MMLAQQWLHGCTVKSKYDKYLASRLTLPTKYNPREGVTVLNNVAERIVFTDDVPSLLYSMYENKQITYQGMLSTVRLPYDLFWLEYQSRVGMQGSEFNSASYGALVERRGNEVAMILVTGIDYKDKNDPVANGCAITHVIVFPTWPPTVRNSDGDLSFACDVDYAYNAHDLKTRKESVKELGAIICEIIFGIFLVTHTKVYAAEEVTYKPSHKRARLLKGKPPLLEYRRIRLHIGKGRKQYAQRPAINNHIVNLDDEASIQHRRYHKVMGHFRHYLKHDPPHTTWIEPHYRGDPSIGVTFTEREVLK
jgi:hypothetical protein